MQVSRAARMAFQRIESEDLKDCMGEHQNLANLDVRLHLLVHLLTHLVWTTALLTSSYLQ